MASSLLQAGFIETGAARAGAVARDAGPDLPAAGHRRRPRPWPAACPRRPGAASSSSTARSATAAARRSSSTSARAAPPAWPSPGPSTPRARRLPLRRDLPRADPEAEARRPRWTWRRCSPAGSAARRADADRGGRRHRARCRCIPRACSAAATTRPPRSPGRSARLTGVAYLPDALVRRRATEHARAASPASGRKRNVAGAFEVPPGRAPQVAGKRILLIDDVMTTGATAEGCARALKAAGAVRVDVAVVARVKEMGRVTI